MTDRLRTPAELLKHRIVGDTASQIGTAAKAMFDAFTGGHEAVLDSVAEDFEAKSRGEASVPMAPRYRCMGCRGVHREGEGCDAELLGHAPPPPRRRVGAPPPPPPSAPRQLAPNVILMVCAKCVGKGEFARKSAHVAGEECDRCGMVLVGGVAWMV